MKLLHIDAGITPNSVSRQLSAAVAAAVTRNWPNAQVTYRDLDAEPIPHLGSRNLASLGRDPVLQEFLDAEVIVIGAPMYNFGLASQLKAWFDRIMVGGKTFRYTESGPEGLAGDKTVIVASARGGIYAQGTPMEEMDFQERYLATLFRFMGVEDYAFVRAEGLALSPEHREAAVAEAMKIVPSVVSELVSPAFAA
jgi:FMN-dependent NADH-azoreductase